MAWLACSAVGLAESSTATGWPAMRQVALVSVQEPDETYASGMHLPNRENVAALEKQVLAAVTKSGRTVVDLNVTQKLVSSNDFFAAVAGRLKLHPGSSTPALDVRSDYPMLSGNVLRDVLASDHTSVALNMFAAKAEDRFRTWFAPSLGPLLSGVGADGFILVGGSPELEASYLFGSHGVRSGSGSLQRVGSRLALWIGDARGNALATLEESSYTSGTGPDPFQIDIAVQETQETALNLLMKSLSEHPPEAPATAAPHDNDLRD